MMWSIVGSLSNAIAALCAAVAIFITIKNLKNDRENQTREKINLKHSELYKQAIIDSMLKIEGEKIKYINDKLDKMSMEKRVDEDAMKELYEHLKSEMHDCLREVEIIKLFNRKLYQEVKQITEHIFDMYSQIIDKSMRQKYVSKHFDEKVNEDWTKLRSSIYKCYIKEDFD